MTGKETVDRKHFFQLSPCEYNLTGRSMKLSKQRASLDVSACGERVEPVTTRGLFKNRLDKFWQRCGH